MATDMYEMSDISTGLLEFAVMKSLLNPRAEVVAIIELSRRERENITEVQRQEVRDRVLAA